MSLQAISWNEFIDRLLPSEAKHHLWLRALSYLEYIGYRKMVKAVPYAKVNAGVYRHLSDEIQHSFMLREIADKQFGHKLSFEEVENLVEMAESYFQGLDSQVDDWIQEKLGIKDPYASYVWVSYSIEKRAMKVYPPYLAKLSQQPIKLVIQKIIKDEAEHLSYLENLLQKFPEAISLIKESDSLPQAEAEGEAPASFAGWRGRREPLIVKKSNITSPPQADGEGEAPASFAGWRGRREPLIIEQKCFEGFLGRLNNYFEHVKT